MRMWRSRATAADAAASVMITITAIEISSVAIEKATPEQLWIRDLVARLPFGKVLVAIANKHARQLWAMLAREEDYDAHAWLKHPMVQRPRSTRPFQTA